MNLYLQQKNEKHVIKHVSNLKQHKCISQPNVVGSNKKRYIMSWTKNIYV